MAFGGKVLDRTLDRKSVSKSSGQPINIDQTSKDGGNDHKRDKEKIGDIRSNPMGNHKER